MISDHFRVVLVGVVALCLFGMGLSPVSAATTTQPVRIGSTSDCQDVVVLGAQGSGQTYDQNEGFGPEAWLGLESYAAHMDGYKVGYSFVPYPAAPVDVEKLLHPTTQALFFASIDDGVEETLTFLQARHDKCGGENEHYVLIGYSQGAMVMHRVLTYLALAPRAEHLDLAYHLLPMVDGVLAIADGDKVAHQGGSSYGTALDSGLGVTWLGNLLKKHSFEYPPLNGSVPNFNNWPAQRFHSVCQKEDLVCDISGLGKRTWWGGPVKNYIDLKRSEKIHTASYGPGGAAAGHVGTAAWNIANTSKALKPTPNPPTNPNPNPREDAVLGVLPVRVGQEGLVRLYQDGGDVDSVEWLSEPIPNAQLSPGEPTIPATLTWSPSTVATVNYSVRVTYLDGVQQELSGSFKSFAVPTPSLEVGNVQTAYSYDSRFRTYVTKVTAEVSKTTSSDTTPLAISSQEDLANGLRLTFASGDGNANGVLDSGETWSYEGYFPWYEWELRNEINYTMLVHANDRTGAGGFVDTEFGITLNRLASDL